MGNLMQPVAVVDEYAQGLVHWKTLTRYEEGTKLYTAEQMRKYAANAVEAERARVKAEKTRCYVAR